MLSVKNNDCLICAIAEVQGISWKVAKRRYRKFRSTKKGYSCNSDLVKKYGIKGYETLKTGEWDSISDAMRYGKGVIIISFGGGFGHAVAWNGYKVVDNGIGGTVTDMDNHTFNLDDRYCVSLMLRQKNVGALQKAKNRAICSALPFKHWLSKRLCSIVQPAC